MLAVINRHNKFGYSFSLLIVPLPLRQFLHHLSHWVMIDDYSFILEDNGCVFGNPLNNSRINVLISEYVLLVYQPYIIFTLNVLASWVRSRSNALRLPIKHLMFFIRNNLLT